MSVAFKRVIHHRTFLALITLVLLWGGFALAQRFAAPGRLDPALREAVSREETIGRIAVNFDFVPEDFHINYLQQYGVVAGVEGKTIFLVQVPVNEVRQLSELYWIQSIRFADK